MKKSGLEKAGFKTNIHQNKDWNMLGTPRFVCASDGLRPTSIKTRIETDNLRKLFPWVVAFKTNIHQNKDWNNFVVSWKWKIKKGLRPTSIKTRIETAFVSNSERSLFFRLRPTSIKTRIETLVGSANEWIAYDV